MSDDLVKRLRDTPNWKREEYGDYKYAGVHYDRAPFEAANRIEELEKQNASLEAKLAKVEDRLFNCAMDLNIYMDLVEKLQEELDNRERSNELRKETTDAGR